MNRNIFAVIGLLAIGFVTFTSSPETVPTVAANPAIESTSPIVEITSLPVIESAQDQSDEPGVSAADYTLTAGACTAGSCGLAASHSSRSGTIARRGLFGRRIVSYSGHSRGRWFPGKNLGRLFGRRR